MNNTFEISKDGKVLIKCLNKNLLNAIIPDGITEIGSEAFYGCNSLRRIHMRVTNIKKRSINDDAFGGIDNDNCVLYVPPGTRWAYMYHRAFSRYSNLKLRGPITGIYESLIQKIVEFIKRYIFCRLRLRD